MPYQVVAIFYSKAVDFRHKASAGIDGWLAISKQSFIFMLFVRLFFAAYASLHRVSDALERLRNHLVREKFNHACARTLALWIRRGNAYVPWVIMLFAVYIAEDLLAGTDITQIWLTLPYIAFYMWYRISLNLAVYIMGWWLSRRCSVEHGREAAAAAYGALCEHLLLRIAGHPACHAGRGGRSAGLPPGLQLCGVRGSCGVCLCGPRMAKRDRSGGKGMATGTHPPEHPE